MSKEESMPLDLLLVRHGHSEINEANSAARKGDPSFFTPEYRQTAGSEASLTPTGIHQSEVAGAWINENFPDGFDEYIVSPLRRTLQTAGHLGLLGPDEHRWRIDWRVEERYWGEFGSIPLEEQLAFVANAVARKTDPLRWRPENGASLIDVRTRVQLFFGNLVRESAGKRVVVVTHGEWIDVARSILHFDSDEQWLAKRRDKTWKIGNAAMLHLSRTVPLERRAEFGTEASSYLAWSRLIQPDNLQPASEWSFHKRPRYSDEELKRM